MNYFYYILARLMPTNAVNRAVSAISKAAAALAAAEDIQNNRASSIDAQIDTLRVNRADALAEAARARRIADRLSDLTA